MSINFTDKKIPVGLLVVPVIILGAVFLCWGLESGIWNSESEIKNQELKVKENTFYKSGETGGENIKLDSLGIKIEDEESLADKIIKKGIGKALPVVASLYLNMDSDSDGFLKFQDCCDNDGNINPGQEEICRNRIDDNCDEEIDENCGVIIKVPEDYRTIQEAINSAFSDDVVKVAPGIYQENVVVKEGVSLIGDEESLLSKIHQLPVQNKKGGQEDSLNSDKQEISHSQVIIDGGRSGNVISFPEGVTEKTKLSGFTIVNSGKNLNGIFIDSASPTVENNIIENNDYNIYIRGGSSPLIQNNISRLSAKGIQIYNTRNVEDDSPKERLEKSKLAELDAGDNNSGEGSENNTEEEKKILPRIRIINNLITDNRAGIDLYQSFALIEHNTISYNNRSEDYYGPTYGIYLLQSSAEITNNVITDNGICELCAGISVDERSAEVEIEDNNIWNNQNNYFCSLNDCVLSETNISVNPEFVDPANNDYHLNTGLLYKNIGIIY